MSAINIKSFGGMVPALDDRNLPDNAAANSQNVFLYRGVLRPLPTPRLLRAVPVGTTKSFRIPEFYESGSYSFDNSDWLDFTNSQTDVIRAPVFGDTFDRYYWASSTSEPRYATRAMIAASDPSWKLGVTEPGVAPGVSVTGGSGTTESRAYVYTWVSAYGEEGPPSPPTVVTGFINGSWDLTWNAPAAADQGVDRTLTHARVYRTVTSASGVATYFLVGEFAIATLLYSDTLSDTVVSGNAQLESFTWSAPPEDLQGFTMMPNGIVAAWRENELWFSEPYRPHAWPAGYVLTVPFPIVGLGIAGQTLAVLTAGYPMTASGVNPAYITTTTLTTFEPCISRESILSAPEGVYYASPNGLVLVTPGSAQNITRDLLTAERWAELAPVLVKAGRFGTAYYAFGSLAGEIFDGGAFEFSEGAFQEADESGSQQGILIDPRDIRVAFNRLIPDDAVYGVMNDDWSGDLFIIANDNLYWFDNRDQAPDYGVMKWKSKLFHAPKKQNFGAMKVYFEVPATAPAQQAERDNTLVQELGVDQYGLVRVYADNTLVATRELRTSGELMRLPTGFKAEYWQIEVEARVFVSQLMMASSAKELAVG